MPSKHSDNYNVCIFAYNEERNIDNCLTTIFSNIDENLNNCYLLANGCTDDTVSKAKKIKQKNKLERLHIIELEIADKCNAWNYYIHKVAESSVGCHFMIDADVSFSEQSFPKLFALLKNCPETVNTIAGMPLTGRNSIYYRSLVEDKSCFFGNLYGITPRFFDLITTKKFFLPMGLNWIDSFLTKAANTDISFEKFNLPNRVTYLANVGFHFESLSPFSWSDINLYKNRIARYELGKLQELFLDETPIEEWPRNMDTINKFIYDDFDELTKSLSIIKRVLVKKRLTRLLIDD